MNQAPVTIIEEAYEIYLPDKKIEAVLILFPGYPHQAADTRREFNILEIAQENNIAVVFMNYNQKLWLELGEKNNLANQLQTIVKNHQLPTAKVFIGGFSSGGLVSLLISDYIVAQRQFLLQPKGVFIVDSPIDLAALYRSSEKNIERNYSPPSVQESTWLIEELGTTFGHPDEQLDAYEKHAVYTHASKHTDNVKHLKNTAIRLYTEPDTAWWKENRMADYEQMNAFYIKEFASTLIAKGYEQVDYIPTTNKGYRANGNRHPHNWSIVDAEELVSWIKKYSN